MKKKKKLLQIADAKPCPGCGAVDPDLEIVGVPVRTWRVICTRCGWAGPLTNVDEALIFTPAILAWNRRTIWW